VGTLWSIISQYREIEGSKNPQSIIERDSDNISTTSEGIHPIEAHSARLKPVRAAVNVDHDRSSLVVRGGSHHIKGKGIFLSNKKGVDICRHVLKLKNLRLLRIEYLGGGGAILGCVQSFGPRSLGNRRLKATSPYRRLGIRYT
jgi:hypothetical protein